MNEDFKKNIIFMFPGVGSEYYGMGKDIYNRYSVVKKIYREAQEAIGLDFCELCFGEDTNKIKKLEYAQTALICLSYAIFHVVMEELEIEPDYLLGYSLGEYSALVCSEVINFQDALKLVKERSSIINKVSSIVGGTMGWVINMRREKVEEIVNELLARGHSIYISAYESDEKVSVSGDMKSIEVFSEIVEENGGMVILIKMSGPFHSPLMKEASEEYHEVLKKYKFNKPKYKIVANRDGQLYTDSDEKTRQKLSEQLDNPVLWQQSLKNIMNGVYDIAIELGPKDVLQYIMKINNNNINYSIETFDSIQKIKADIINSNNNYSKIIKKCLGAIIATPNKCKDQYIYKNRISNQYLDILESYKNSLNVKMSTKDIYGIINKTISILRTKGEEDLIIKKDLKNIIGNNLLIE